MVLEEIQDPATVDEAVELRSQMSIPLHMASISRYFNAFQACEAANEAPPSAADVQDVQVIDVTAVATSSGNAVVAADAPCTTSFGVTVTVGSTTGIVYPQAELAHGATATRPCNVVDTGYQNDITLSCDRPKHSFLLDDPSKETVTTTIANNRLIK